MSSTSSFSTSKSVNEIVRSEMNLTHTEVAAFSETLLTFYLLVITWLKGTALGARSFSHPATPLSRPSPRRRTWRASPRPEARLGTASYLFSPPLIARRHTTRELMHNTYLTVHANKLTDSILEQSLLIMSNKLGIERRTRFIVTQMRDKLVIKWTRTCSSFLTPRAVANPGRI